MRLKFLPIAQVSMIGNILIDSETICVCFAIYIMEW